MEGILVFLALTVPPVALLTWFACTRRNTESLPARSASDFFSSMGGGSGGGV